MEQIKAIVVKVQTTKDQCTRVTVDADKLYTEGINLLAWQDKEVTIILKEE
jgi:hypothetical protein